MASSAEPMARVAGKSIPDLKKGQSFFLKGYGAATPFFQPRLTVGPVDDVYEREADAVADRVMRMREGDRVHTKISPVALQRKCAACQEEEDHVQRKEEGGVLGDEIFESAPGTGEGPDMSSAMSRSNVTVQRSCAACGQEEEHVQRKEDHAGSEAPPMVSEALASSGHAMDHASQHFMESRLGYDFSNVRIHTDTVAAKSAKSINALAYTSGNDIVFGQGQYTPGTDTGKKLLAHELTHVVQQKGLQRKIQRCPDPASTAQFTATAAQIRAHANYTALSASDRTVADEIITLSSSRDDCIHFIDRLLVLFDTPVNMSPSVGAAASAAMATAAGTERDRLATPEGARLADIEERTARDPATNFTTMNPPARTWGHMATFQMDNRDPNNIVVQARIRVTGNATDVANVVAQEDGIEKAAQEMGYTLDVIFVNTGGPNVFTVSINPAAAVDAGNWSAYSPDPSAYTHEIHHLLGLSDRYDYTSHADNQRMTISSRLGWFRIEAGRPARSDDEPVPDG